MHKQIDFEQLLQWDSKQTLVLTVNNRYARRLLIQIQQTLGTKKAIAVPDIMPLSAWLVQVNDELSFYDDYVPASYLLDNFSSLHLWEQIIYQQEPDQSALIDVPQAAKSALEADRLIDEWQLSWDEQEQTEDSARFLVWRSQYKRYLDEYDLDDSNRATQRVVQALANQVFRSPWKRVVLVGFHEFSARTQHLLQALTQQEVEVYQLLEPQMQAVICESVQTETPDSEWRLAARWAAQQLRSNPTGRYAIVALDLQNEAAYAHRVLAHELAPISELDDGFKWNIAVGRPLSQWPLVHAALTWLKLLAAYQQGRVSCALFGEALLVGHCIASEQEKQQRAQTDVKLRKLQKRFLEAAEVDHRLFAIEKLGHAWQEVSAYLNALPAPLTPTRWVPHLRHLLKQLGFPGDLSLDSHGYQVMRAFDQRLGQFARLAPVFGELSLSHVVHMLARFLAETQFQPERDTLARLDVLGALEAEGGSWDALWVIGVTDAMLPAIPNPNPFIPYSVLRHAQAPRATPERELEWSYRLMHALKAAAPHIICSYALQDNGQAIRPSPLLADMDKRQVEDPLRIESSQSVAMEQIQDEQGPAVPPDQPVFGGSALLDRQARNPLWAFVQYRLHAAALPSYDDSSIVRMWRGSFLHRCIELFWNSLTPRTSAQLKRLAQQKKIESLLAQAIQIAANELLAELPRVLVQLEKERAQGILKAWLDMEQQRESFSVAALEQKHQLTGLNTQMRIDRIDELPDGSLFLIDYKSSRFNKNYTAWLRPRPIELQLPVYAAILAEQNKAISALAFGFLNYQTGYGGYSQEGVMLTETEEKKLNEELGGWSQLLQHLAQQVLVIRDEFLAGHAQNSFLHANDLMYCEVLPFLRLYQEIEDEF